MDLLETGRALRMLRVQVDASRADAAQRASRHGLALVVGGAARVHARVLGVDVRDVQRHVTEVVRRVEARRHRQRLTVDQPTVEEKPTHSLQIISSAIT